MLLEGLRPLLVGAAAAPAWFVRRDIGNGALLERDGLRVRSYLLASCRALGLKWIAALNTQPLGIYGLVACLLKGDIVATAKAHMVLLVADAVSEKPIAGTAGSNLQIGAVANSVTSRLGDFCQVLGVRIASHVHPQVYAWEIT